MDDARLVGGVHGPRQRLQQRRRLGGRQRLAAELLVEAAAAHVLQREERQAAVLADVVNLDDVRVPQPGDRQRLAPEALELLRGGVRPGEDHLQGDDAVQAPLPGLVDDAHAAAAQLLQNVVSFDRRKAAGGDGSCQGVAQRRVRPRRQDRGAVG